MTDANLRFVIENDVRGTDELAELRAQFIAAREEVDSLKVRITELDRAQDEAAEKTRKKSEEDKKGKLSLTELKAGYDLLNEAVQIGNQIYGETIAKAADWGDSMGDLAAITGATTEQTSLMVAAFELVDVGVGSIESAIKAMTKNGLTPNLETMKELAIQYQAIQDPVEKNKFLFENFGKAGLDLAEIMGSDVETLERLENAARSSGKVIGDDAANASAEYNIQAAIMQQRVEGLAISIGNTLIPAINEYLTLLDENYEELVAITGQLVTTTGTYEEYVTEVQRAEIAHGNLTPSTNALIASGRLMTEQMFNAARATALWNDATAEADREARRFASAQGDIEKPVITAEEALEAQREELRLNSEQMERLGNLMGGEVGNELRSFADSQTELKDKAEELRGKIDELEKKKYLTPAQKTELEETRNELRDVNGAIDENAKAHEDATKRILFSILQQQAAVDGFTTDEVAALTTVAEKWGLIDPATKNATDAISGALAKASKDGNWQAFYGAIDTAKNKLLGIPTNITTTLTLNYQTNGTPNPAQGDIGLPGGDSAPVVITNPDSGNVDYGGLQALGGDYVVTRPTVFVAGESGTERVRFTPVGAGGVEVGNPLTINVDARGSVLSEAQIEAAVRRALDKAGATSRTRVETR